MSKVHARSHEITNKPLRVPASSYYKNTVTSYWLEKQTLMLRGVPQMLKKWRIVVNKISKVRLATCNWIKKILDEATSMILLFVFIMFNKLTCKVRFHIAVWSLSKSTRASSFIENFRQISAKPIAFQRNLLEKLPRNRPFFTNHFSAKLASKIPAKFPRNRPFFPRICPRKSREIWHFFPRPTRSPVFIIIDTENKCFPFPCKG